MRSLLLCICLLGLASFSHQQQSLYQIVLQNPETTTFAGWIKASPLYTTYDNTASETYTVFAPTNAAIKAATDAGLLKGKDQNQLVQYHSLSGVFLQSIEGRIPQGRAIQTVLPNQYIFANSIPDEIDFGFANGFKFRGQMEPSNGVVYTLDGLMIPPTTTLAQAIAANADLSQFNTLIQRVPAISAMLAAARSNITVFAPNNAAFAKLTAGYVDGLNATQVDQLISAHIIPTSVIFSQAITSDTTAQSQSGLMLTFASVSGANSNTVTINGMSTITAKADMISSNGALHIVDTVIMPGSNPATSSSGVPTGSSASNTGSESLPSTTASGSESSVSSDNTGSESESSSVLTSADDTTTSVDTSSTSDVPIPSEEEGAASSLTGFGLVASVVVIASAFSF